MSNHGLIRIEKSEYGKFRITKCHNVGWPGDVDQWYHAYGQYNGYKEAKKKLDQLNARTEELKTERRIVWTPVGDDE